MSTNRADIDDFLAQRRIAMVGISRDPRDFSRKLFREMRSRGYDIVPVNLFAEELEGEDCFQCLQVVQPKVDGVLLMTPPWETERVVHECAELGVPRVWMYRAGKRGAVSEKAVEFCHTHGIRVAEGCPYMFLEASGFPHRVHGFLLRLAGHYPAKAA
jgi:predicted CoA-binding protein